MKNKTISVFCGFLAIIFISITVNAQTSSAAKSGSGYHLLKKIAVGGEGGWDYLYADSNAHRLYSTLR